MPVGRGENSYTSNNRFIWQEGYTFTKQGNGWGIKRKNPQALMRSLEKTKFKVFSSGR